MPQLMGTPPGPQMQTFAPGVASPSMMLSPGPRMPTRRASLTPPRPLGPSAASLSPGQLGGLVGPAGPAGMQLRDPLGGRGGASVEQLQQGMAGLSLMGGQGVAQPPPPPPPQAQMMLEGGVMVPQARPFSQHPAAVLCRRLDCPPDFHYLQLSPTSKPFLPSTSQLEHCFLHLSTSHCLLDSLCSPSWIRSSANCTERSLQPDSGDSCDSRVLQTGVSLTPDRLGSGVTRSP